MNLKKYIQNYNYNSLRKVIISHKEYAGLILQKEFIGPVYFYNVDVYNVYTKYRVFPRDLGKSTSFELLELEKIRTSDKDNHHHKWLSDTWKALRFIPCLDMRNIYKNKFAGEINEA